MASHSHRLTFEEDGSFNDLKVFYAGDLQCTLQHGRGTPDDCCACQSIAPHRVVQKETKLRISSQTHRRSGRHDPVELTCSLRAKSNMWIFNLNVKR